MTNNALFLRDIFAHGEPAPRYGKRFCVVVETIAATKPQRLGGQFSGGRIARAGKRWTTVAKTRQRRSRGMAVMAVIFDIRH
jgi:hypothetical protein